MKTSEFAKKILEYDLRTGRDRYYEKKIFDRLSQRLLVFGLGTGDNLLDEDIEAGYVDYVNYSVGEFDGDACGFTIVAPDSGMVMISENESDLQVLEEVLKEGFESDEIDPVIVE